MAAPATTIGFPVTHSSRFTRLSQYIAESTFGTTPVSPTFVDASVISSFEDNHMTENEKYRRLGNRNIYRAIKTRQAFTFGASWSPVDTSLIRYGMNDPGGAGTLDESLTFAQAFNANSGGTLAEYFQFRRGCKIDSITVSVAGGLVECEADFICREITVPSLTHGLGTPVWATATTATPWSHLTGGANPLTIDGVTYPTRSFSCTVNNSLDGVPINGAEFIEALEPTTKEVTFEFEILIGKDFNLDADVKSLVGNSASYVINSTGPKTLTFTNFRLTNKTDPWAADSTEAKSMRFSGDAETVVVSS